MPGKVQPQQQQFKVREGVGEGEYRLAVSSGLLSGVVAGDATNGHIFAARWAPVAGSRSRVCVVKRVAVTLKTITGFTAAQEVAFDASVLRGYSASHTGGTAIVLTGDKQKKRQSYGTSAFADMRIATTAQLTAGTHTFDPQPFVQDGFADLAAAATTPKGSCFNVFPPDTEISPIVLAPNEGICIRNVVALGAAGTARLTVELDWLELERY